MNDWMTTLKRRAVLCAGDDLPIDRVIDGLMVLKTTTFTPVDIMDATGLVSEKDVISSLIILSGDPLHVVRGRWRYVDGSRVYPLTGVLVREIIETNKFTHPDRGTPVHDFAETIHLVWELEPAFVDSFQPSQLIEDRSSRPSKDRSLGDIIQR